VGLLLLRAAPPRGTLTGRPFDAGHARADSEGRTAPATLSSTCCDVPGQAGRPYLAPIISAMRFCISAIRSIMPAICFISRGSSSCPPAPAAHHGTSRSSFSAIWLSSRHRLHLVRPIWPPAIIAASVSACPICCIMPVCASCRLAHPPGPPGLGLAPGTARTNTAHARSQHMTRHRGVAHVRHTEVSL